MKTLTLDTNCLIDVAEICSLDLTRAAESALTGAERAAMTLNATIAGFEPRLFGGGLVQMAGLRAELDGERHLQNVTHELSSAGLITSIQATKGRSDIT